MKRRRLAGDRVVFLGSHPERVPVVGLPEVAFAGRSNVGKSSAINRLLGVRGAARVSGRPGRTQAINLFEVEGRMVWADLPGYGFARVPREVRAAWKGLVEGYLGDDRPLRLVVLLVDPRREPQEMDGTLLWGLREAGLPVLVVATKADKLKRRPLQAALERLRGAWRLGPDELLAMSAHTGQGVPEVRAAIERAVR